MPSGHSFASRHTPHGCERVESCQSVSAVAKKHGVAMPIVEHVAALIAGEMSPYDLVSALISRQAKPEKV